MKWIFLIIILGIVEITTIGELHSILGTKGLVILYIVTTVIGAFFLYLRLAEFKLAMKAMKGIQKKLKKRARDLNFEPTVQEVEKLNPMMFIGLYVPAICLIAIPGIVSDLIGILMVAPIVSNWLVERQVKKAIKNAKTSP
jgi:UPF0716 family protein affecting phage T7 exclusion